MGVTYSERLNGSELLNNCLFLSEISSTDSQSGGCDDGKTDGYTNNEQDQSVMEEVVGRVFRSGDLQVTEESTDPCDENPANDQDQERRADGVHDGLEMTSVLSTRNQRSSATDERHLCRVSDNTVCLSTLATSSVVDNIGDVFIDGEGLSSHGRLIDGEKSVSRAMLLSVFLILILSLCSVARITTLRVEFVEVGLVSGRVVICADDSGIGGDDLSILNDDLQMC